MTYADTTAQANRFLSDAVMRLKALPFSDFVVWPEYPDRSPIDLRIPATLSQYIFTLTKETLPGGQIRIALQRRQLNAGHGTRGLVVDGFVIASDEISRSLNQREVWYLT